MISGRGRRAATAPSMPSLSKRRPSLVGQSSPAAQMQTHVRSAASWKLWKHMRAYWARDCTGAIFGRQLVLDLFT